MPWLLAETARSAHAQDVLVLPGPDDGADKAHAGSNIFAPLEPKMPTAAEARPVQGEVPEPARLIGVKGLAEPLVATRPTGREEDTALLKAVAAFEQGAGGANDFAEAALPLLDYLALYPDSPWNMALQANLGIGYYRDGYFSRALESLQTAWELGEASRIPEAKRLTDLAYGELLQLNAKLGRLETLKALLAQRGDRPIEGRATELVTGAEEGVGAMTHRPETAYLCGPRALRNVLRELKAGDDQLKIVDAAQSGRQGVSLKQLSQLADQAGLRHRIVRREPGQPIPVPSVIHWKLNHYAAIVGESDGRYRIQDPTFLIVETTVSRAAIEAEGSGYFLVPESAVQKAGADAERWAEIAPDSAEAQNIYGRGFPTNHIPGATGGNETMMCGSSGQRMCAVNAHMAIVSLSLSDPASGYRSALGTDLNVRLTYNQREETQPANFMFTNIGQKWNLHQIAYVYFSTADTGNTGTITQRLGGGGERMHQGYTPLATSTPGIYKLAYKRETQTGERFYRTPNTGGTAAVYESIADDGSRRVYNHWDGVTSGMARKFLTQDIDPQGNITAYAYTNLTGTQGSVTCAPACVRLDTITDPAGKVTTLRYDLPAYPLLVTRVTDPFGRDATFTYDVNMRLKTITDPIGIASGFDYDAGGLVNMLKTPYGASSFTYGQDGTAATAPRWLTITGPEGQTRRLEFRHSATGIVASDAAALLPAGMNVLNGYNQFRNSFLWNEHVTAAYGTGDFNQATIFHWQHARQPNANYTSSALESVKRPLENRLWFNYTRPDGSPADEGSLRQPTASGRVLDDGTTKLEKATYIVDMNVPTLDWGSLLTRTDALGRTVKLTYGNNTKDVTKVERQISATPTYATLAQFTYNSAHRPLTYTDAAGQVWKYAYNAAGQMTYATNPLNETRFWEYDSAGRLTRETVPYAVAHASVTYGTTNLLAATARSYDYTTACAGVAAPANTNLPVSMTDSEGYKLCYAYDALDRVTKVKYPDGTTMLYDYNFPAGWTANGVNYAGTASLDVWKVTDRMGRETRYTYDRNRRLTAVSAPVRVGASDTTRTTQYAYYADGTLKTLTDANGNVTHWAIDLQSRPVSKTYAYGTGAAQTESYTYDLAGRLKTVTDPEGRVKTYTYNKDDSIASLSYTNPGGTTATPNVSFAYDAFWPRLSGMTDMSGNDGSGNAAAATTSFSYTAVGTNGALQLLQEANGGYYNQHAAYYYDAAGRLSQRWAAESQEGFGYDTLGRVDGYWTDLGAFTYGYLGQTNRPVSRSVTNGGTTVTTNWTYDTNANDRRLLTINHNNSAVRSYAFAYTFTGGSGTVTDVYNIRKITESATAHPLGAQIWTYGYDQGDRLLSAVGANNMSGGTSAGSWGWEYDRLDNATKLTYPDFGGYSDYPTYNALNQQTQNAWWQNFEYTPSGDIKREYNEVPSDMRTYKYDMEGRLVEMTDPRVPGGHTVAFRYDGFGRRILQKTTVNGVSTYKRYLWCGQTLCQLRDSGTNPLRRYLETGEYVNAQGLTPEKKYLYREDQLGSVRDLVDATTGARVGALDYAPYGHTRATSGTLPDYRYAGLLWVGEVGLSASATRFYDGGTTRFMTRDWAGESGGLNLYAYAGANPVNRIDPNGTFAIPVILLPVAIIGGTTIIGGMMALPNIPTIPSTGWRLPNIPILIDALPYIPDAAEIIGTLIAQAILDENCPPASRPGQMQKEVEKGKAPKEVDRVDKGIGPFEQDHVHLGKNGEAALNKDGSWKHGSMKLPKSVKEWLLGHGWTIPK